MMTLYTHTDMLLQLHKSTATLDASAACEVRIVSAFGGDTEVVATAQVQTLKHCYILTLPAGISVGSTKAVLSIRQNDAVVYTTSIDIIATTSLSA
ncbi:hypothetical protein I2I05_08545 [Hymenobacter sp. BT683]|uniref:Uncharacterized protein n=1 Tax=Hymenobacter jeongseonensis TaxID=2791027 RepID=A0ABS0IGI1_9BACT|nr:hypothetical protein [Hymenobacter jeongseonensis]MBF9237445.1 hypothetical protein [Hymenobacter jeongseonensis]